ncbi:hypothetical protein OHA57_00010 [Streptomyces anulatus]|uniref:hypothetical protein n=1 Tax=Streptomyces anulatus TaxID=1892 RepID=UPI002DDB875F|nr:hypothetical protein [Streptomyces anulatus]WSC59213.1 hypothetical protein OHA57_00010 [Streptomyces anulatus]
MLTDEIAQAVDACLSTDRADRIQQGAALVEELAHYGFDGPEYLKFRDELWTQSEPILKGMIRNGRLGQLAIKRHRERGIALWISPEDAATLKADDTARDEILIEMQINALRTFRRKALVEKGWNPNYNGPRGASCLMTYYIHTCIWEFGRVFKKWAQERVRWHELHALSDFGEETPSGRRGIARLLQASGYLDEPGGFVTIFEEILDEQKGETQAVIRLTIDGHPDAEIADKLKITNAAVRMRRTRFRKVIYQAARDRRIRIPEHLHTKAEGSRTKHQAGAA